jgi:hypothetical protein
VASGVRNLYLMILTPHLALIATHRIIAGAAAPE